MTTTLPCPFCGHHEELRFESGSTFRWLAYSCRECTMGSEVRTQARSDVTFEQWQVVARQAAIKEWNTRAPTPGANSAPTPARTIPFPIEALQEIASWHKLVTSEIIEYKHKAPK